MSKLSDERLAEIRKRIGGMHLMSDGQAFVGAVADRKALVAHIDALEAERAETTRALEVCRGERFGTDPAAWAQALPVQENDRAE